MKNTYITHTPYVSLLHARQFSVCFRSYYIGINALAGFHAERGRKKMKFTIARPTAHTM